METKDTAPERIYLDYNATTPLDPRVLEAMMPYLREHFGNPASGQHAWGWAAEQAVEKAREQVATLIGAETYEIVFTSGATEANNWALRGLFRQHQENSPQQDFHIITSPVEHKSVLSTALALEKQGAKLTFLPVNKWGQVSIQDLDKYASTSVVSLMAVNNEIGSNNPCFEIGQWSKKTKSYFHSDATQAVGKVPVDVNKDQVDLMSFSAHKFYGPKGIGALYIRGKNPVVSLPPLIYGGGHERGLRSGTLNVPAIVGFGAAAHIAKMELASEQARTSKFRDLLIAELLKIPGAQLNGHPTDRSPINISMTFKGQPVDQRLAKLQRLGFSTGSACSAGRTAISHVLAGIGLSEKDAECTLRLSVGRQTTEQHIETAIQILRAAFLGQPQTLPTTP